MTKEEPSSLVEAIARIAKFSYEPSIKKYPYLKTHIKKLSNPEDDWVVYVATAGIAYALITKDAYPGENEEINESIKSNGLYNAVSTAFDFIKKIHDTDARFFRYGMGLWVWHNLTTEKPTPEIYDSFFLDIGKLLDTAIKDYEKKHLE